MHDLDRMFRPGSIAIIGASNDRAKLGGRVMHYVHSLGFAGRVYPINASAGIVQGKTAWPSVLDLPEVPDSALMLLPAPLVARALDECGRKGIRHVQVMSAGFAEEGGAGAAMQEAVVAVARQHGIRITGPNALGSISPPDGFYATFSSLLATLRPSPGKVGIATQSGAFGSHVYGVATQRNIGISRAVATGNEADIDVAAVIDYLAEDPGTTVIFAALEGCRDGARLRAALLKAAAAAKPVIVMKVGKSDAGAAAAATHTGSLAGEDRFYDAVFRECGAFRATSISAALDLAHMCAIAPLPPTDDVAILTLSGGIGVLMADACLDARLNVPLLPDDVLHRVRAILPYAGGRNPIDTTARIATQMPLFASVGQELIQSAQAGTILLYLSHIGRDEDAFSPLEAAVADLREASPDHLVVTVMTSTPTVRGRLEALGIPVFEDPTEAVAAVGAAATLRRLMRKAAPLPAAPAAGELDTLPMDEAATKALLVGIGLPVPTERTCTTADDAATAAAAVGFPVAMKILSPDILHKTEVGGVLLDIPDAAAAAAGFATLTGRVRAARPQARIGGVLVAPMISGGVETIVGVQCDPVFGPMVMFGLGGIFVEAFKDVAFASAPLTPARAEDLIDSINGARLLGGWRGGRPLDRATLVKALCAVSMFATSHAAQIDSIEINPFLVRTDDAFALDAVLVGRSRACDGLPGPASGTDGSH